MDVAAGPIAYDRTDLPFSSNVGATLDRFILPAGLSILNLAPAFESREFVPPRWLARKSPTRCPRPHTWRSIRLPRSPT
jgi:hypothetical protein